MTDNNAWGRPEPSSSNPGSSGNTQIWGTPSSPASPTQEPEAKSTGKGKRLTIIVVAVLAVLALVGAGAWALLNKQDSGDDQGAATMATTSSPSDSATSEKSSSTDSDEDAEKKTEGKANNAASANAPTKYEKCNDFADEKLSSWTRPIKQYCDDSWLFVGQDGTANFSLYYWTDNAWHKYDTDGRAWPSDIGCYDQDKLKDAGAPLPLLDKVTLCTDEGDTSTEAEEDDEEPAADEFAWAGKWNGKCDGRYILIVESALISGPEPYTETSRIQDKYPGSKILYGGACSSLRNTVDGKSVYAIYYDAGYSVDKVCSLKAQYGGNARSLNDDGDFSDPC
ncbi:hypothetical protein [Corynebacterium sp.]|uniref:hypothetical protein n=2 Tax=Bacteria TaxID=2 RepID=UPI00291048B5|nr:hypothetical protein [Corynebacterium sp.]MDU4570376.1 hypothetical protein [Corynebacterium sp.]MDU6012159.1 hypothetical protein [Corynebacterium sp.]MDU7511343.1 hypothetical protein [Corynebacterium sp.]MDU7566542.1 hypothetical protein [Corynebacterium sp.]